MKNIIKLAVLTAILFTTSIAFAQDTKKETTKAGSAQSKNSKKADPSSQTKMAINEQGVPKKGRGKAKLSASAVDSTKK